jgi:alkylation response protein AidB-like acyl-CoA dehydrogenase
MALLLTEEQTMLQNSAQEFLQRRAPVSHLRALRDEGSETGFSPAVWQEMVAMGWPAIVIDAAHGGLGFGFTGLGIVLQELGRTLTPSPLLSSAMIAAAAIRHGGSAEQQDQLLPAIASGGRIFALAADEGQRHDPRRVETRLAPNGGGFRLDGAKRYVADGMAADTVLVSARHDNGDLALGVVPVDAAGVARQRRQLLDTHVAADFSFQGVAVAESALLGGRGDRSASLRYALDAGVIGQSAELLGVAREAFERTLDYLRQRKQFGVPIGSFQALQHRAAMLCNDLELSTSLVLHALQQLDAGAADLGEVASMTKAKVAETAMRATAEGIQMHGGIGMTDEFEIGFFYKRARILETLLGDRHYHLDRYARERGY